MASVELRRVSKVFAGMAPVLEQVDLRVDDGELLVLLGPNGSGKTTLLRLIAGLERATAGEILIGDQVVTGWSPRRRDVAMVFQSGVLYPHLTVEQNLRFSSWNDGGVLSWIWSRLTNRFGARRTPERSDNNQGSAGRDQEVLASEVLANRVRDTAQLLGIQTLLNRLPRQLSGGERQRVALGRALVRQPAAFLLDEPLANADTKLRQELRIAFQQVRQQFPGTMILVSHDHTEALALGHRIAVLGEGKIQQIGLAQDVFAAPRNRFVAEFLGRSAMSFVTGDWIQEGDSTFFVTDFGRLKLPPQWRDRLTESRLTESRVTESKGRVTMGWRADAAQVRPFHSLSSGPEPLRPDQSQPGQAVVGSWLGVVRRVELSEAGLTAFVSLASVASRRMSVDGLAAELPVVGSAPVNIAAVVNTAVANTAAESELTVVARVRPPEVISPGDHVRIEIDLSRTYWFDTRTGNNLAVSR